MVAIETARLRLRQFQAEDAAAHYAIVGSDPQVTWDNQPGTPEQTAAGIQKRLRHWVEHGFGMWAIEDKMTGELLGHGGIQRMDTPDKVEVGYYLGRPAWGRGVATEAGAAALRYGFETVGLPEIYAVVRPHNAASQHVLAKLGLRYARMEPHYGFDVQLWRIARADWQPAAAPYRVIDPERERGG